MELDKARFSADDIGRRGYRLDFAGGEEEGQFFLQNGGFFNASTQLGSEFSRARQNKEPDIDFDVLEQIPNVSLWARRFRIETSKRHKSKMAWAKIYDLGSGHFL